MNQKWINFKVLREQLDFAEVLRHYRVELKRKKNQLVGFCPLPNHNGQRKSPSFSVNVERKCFNCFGCHRSGNCLDFAIYMEGKDPDNRQHVREVALLVQERFHLSGTRIRTRMPGLCLKRMRQVELHRSSLRRSKRNPIALRKKNRARYKLARSS